MPFRIHYKDVCLTNTEFKPCVLLVPYKQLKAIYDTNQLYSLLPKWGHVQRIQLFQNPNSKPYCLMTNITRTGSNKHSIQISACDENNLSQLYMIKMLTYHPVYYSTIVNNTDKYIVHQRPPSSSLATSLSHVLSPIIVVSIGQITSRTDEQWLHNWYMSSENEEFSIPSNSSMKCMSVMGDTPETSSQNPLLSTNMNIQMVTCNKNDSNQKIILERSTSNAWIKYIRKRLEIAHYYPKPK